MINFKTNRMVEAKSWRYFLIRHQYEIAQLKIAALTERMKDSDQLISFLFGAYKDLFKGENKAVPRPQEGAERLKVAKPLSGRSLARHYTVRQVGGAWGKEADFRRNTRLERSILKNSIAEDEESREVDTDLPLRRLVKTLTTNFQGLDQRLHSILAQYQQYESHLQLIEQEIYSTHKKEMNQWAKLLTEVQSNYTRSLTKKKEEIRRLNSTMALWVHRYLDLEQRIVQGGEIERKAAEELAVRMRKMVEVMEKRAYMETQGIEAAHERRRSMPEQMCSIDQLRGDEHPSQDDYD